MAFSEWVSRKEKHHNNYTIISSFVFPVRPAHFKRRKICSISLYKNALEILRNECMATIDLVWCVCFGQYQYAYRARNTTIQWNEFHLNELDYVCVFFSVRFTKNPNIFIILSRVHIINKTFNEPFRKKKCDRWSEHNANAWLICNHASRNQTNPTSQIEHKRFLIERNNSSLGVKRIRFGFWTLAAQTQCAVVVVIAIIDHL